MFFFFFYKEIVQFPVRFVIWELVSDPRSSIYYIEIVPSYNNKN